MYYENRTECLSIVVVKYLRNYYSFLLFLLFVTLKKMKKNSYFENNNAKNVYWKIFATFKYLRFV